MREPIYLQSCARSSMPALMINPEASGDVLHDEATIRIDALKSLMFFVRCMGEKGGPGDMLGRRDMVALGSIAHLMLCDIEDLHNESSRRISAEHRAALDSGKIAEQSPEKSGGAQ